MKKILISPSIYTDKYNQLYTKLDLNWFKYAEKLNFNLYQIPHKKNLNFIKKENFHGIIFSGGNDLYKLGKKRENLLRDKFEKRILRLTNKLKIPALFVCRGMQLISQIEKIRLVKVKNHIKKKQLIFVKSKGNISVNSFHNYAIFSVPKKYNILANHKDGSIEMMENIKKKHLCIMFHPERYSEDQKYIDLLIQKFFKLKR